MYTLTDRRFTAAQSILEKYRDQIRAGRHIDAHGFERELRQCWKTGYQEIKDIAVQLLDQDRYKLVAASYMEGSARPGVVVEFQGPLAELYGVEQYHSSECKKKKEVFWTRAFSRSSKR